MEIIRVVTGSLDENCYILKKNDKALVIDPGDEYPKIKEAIGDAKVIGVLVTHAHFDHVGALRNFLTNKRMKVFKHSTVQEQEYTIDDFKFEVINTPGHSKDSITFYFKEEGCMFVGDFVFKDTVGRWDLPGGDKEVMYDSIEKIRVYSDNITLYPGHGDKTTLGYEKENNKYFNDYKE